MAKIYAILDHPGYNRSVLNVIEKWKEQGHEVVVDMYYDIEKANWCDIIYGEYIQGGVVGALNDTTMKKPMVVRGIDIDLYFGHYLGVDLDRCKTLLFINNYMKEMAVNTYTGTVKAPKCPVEVVHVGIDTNKWTFRDRSVTRGKTVGWLNNFWSGKGIELLAQIIYKVVKLDPEYQFIVVGPCHGERWLEKYFEEFLKYNGLSNNVKRVESVVSVDNWMEQIDYILSTSMKECMSLPMIEGMAKGVKPIIHHWWDAKELYPDNLVFETVDQAAEMIMGKDYDSVSYRKFVEDNYTLDKEVKALNRILQI
jgi:glycosyltransferase involved in cell wall biosynthesis